MDRTILPAPEGKGVAAGVGVLRVRAHNRRSRLARLVVELGVTPQISTGVLHGSSGAGQIGAGVAHQPLAPFRAALDALVAELDAA